jgi:predicted membrane protein
MELDELKIQLKQKYNTVEVAKTSADLSALLKTRTTSIIGKLKRSLVTEILIGVVFTLLFAVISFTTKLSSVKIYFSVFSIFGTGFLLILFLLYKKTGRLSSTSLPVKKNLETLLSLMKKYLKRYLQLTMALVPICTMFSFLLAYNEQYYTNNNNSLIITLGVYLVVMAVITYFITRWYLKKLYGNYLVQLEHLICELDAE